MGRQAYITRLALGRSAYEEPDIDPQEPGTTGGQAADGTNGSNPQPHAHAAVPGRYVQRYDARGHPINPESRAWTRRLLRAQNDVLATVGVCVVNPASEAVLQRAGVETPPTQDDDYIEALDSTSHTGLLLMMTTSALLFFTTWWSVGLRYRLEAFPWLSGNGFLGTMKMHIQSLGWKRFFLAGLPAAAMHLFLGLGRDTIIGLLHRVLYAQISYSEPSFAKRKRWHKFLTQSDRFLACAWILRLAPFRTWSILQHLGLVTPYRPLPTRGFSAWIFSKPRMSYPAISGRPLIESIKDWTWMLSQWPLFSFFAYTLTKSAVEHALFHDIRPRLSKLVEAEAQAARLARQKGPNRSPAGESHLPDRQQGLLRWWTDVRSWLVTRLIFRPVPMPETTLQSTRRQERNDTGALLGPSEPGPAAHISTAVSDHLATEQSNDDLDPNQRPAVSHDEGFGTPAESPVEASQNGVRAPHDPGEHLEFATLAREITRVRRVLAGAVSDEHLEPGQVHASQPSSSEASLRDRPVRLSLYPIVSLTSRVTEYLAVVLTLPLEAHLIRTLVASYLDASRPPGQSPGTSLAPWPFLSAASASEVYARSQPGAVFGPFSSAQWLSSLWDYTAVELLVGFGLFEVGCQVALRFARWRLIQVRAATATPSAS